MAKRSKAKKRGGAPSPMNVDNPPPAAAAAAADGNPPEANEEQRYSSVSIMQQFAWIRRQRDAAPDGARMPGQDNHPDQEDSPWMHDLVLWSILGFAVDESDYLSLSLVNKDWRDMIALLEPPALFQMTRLLRNNDMLQDSDVALVKSTYESLRYRDCALYRREDDIAGTFPTLQPHFNVIIMRFAYTLCTQRSPHNFSDQMYDMTVQFLASVSERVVPDIWNALLPLRQDASPENAERVLHHVLEYWRDWEGHVKTVVGIADYLDRYHVRHNNLVPLKECAVMAMGRGLVKCLSKETQQPSVTLLLLAQVSKLEMNSERRALLLEAHDACEVLATTPLHAILPIPATLLVLHKGYKTRSETFAAELEQAREEQACLQAELEEIMEQEDQHPVTVISSDNANFPLPLSSHFFKASSFLSKLHLRAGDVVKLNFDTFTLMKAIVFCCEDEVRPLPEIQKPVQSSDLSVLVGQTYADFIHSMDQSQLFVLLTFANLMDFRGLLNLCCSAVAVMIRGQSVEQLRETFNIPNDFTPQEEAQVRAENRAILRRMLRRPR